MHVTPEDTTLAIVRSGDLIFFRNRPVGEGSLEDLVHQTAMYYEDRLGGRGLSRVIVAGSGRRRRARRALEIGYASAWRVSIRATPPACGIASASSELLDAIAAPVGLIVRDTAGAANQRLHAAVL